MEKINSILLILVIFLFSALLTSTACKTEKQEEMLEITVFTDDEITKLNDYSSEFYTYLGSSSDEQARQLIELLAIPDSISKSYTLSFYLLEFRSIREIHAFGTNDKDESFILAKSLDQLPHHFLLMHGS